MAADDVTDYEALAEQELDYAAAATDPAVKTAHLNAAARYATLSEQSAAPHGPPPDPTGNKGSTI